MYDYRRGESILGAFLLGGLVGAVLGLLFAPRSGRENREYIAGKAQEYWGEGKEFYETSRAKVMDETEELRSKIDAARDRLKDQVGSMAEQAKGKVAEIAPQAKAGIDKAAESGKMGVDTAEAKAQAVLDKLSEKNVPTETAPSLTSEPVIE